jgi:non-ribosomal peptide synthetase component F
MPTSYPDVNVVLDALLSSVQDTLGDYFVGMYLYGSLSSGDFDSQRSDIDFVVVTTAQLPEELISALENMHARLAASGLKWAAKLEGTYIPQSALRRHDPDAAPCPCLNEGRFYLARHESDWVIQRYILREHGVVVTGPALRPMIDPVQPDDIRQGVRGILREWWTPLLNDPAWMRSGEYQAYAVLTMCRAWYTLQQGTIASKPVSARWALATLDKQWMALIDWALMWQQADQADHSSETLDFIRYTLEHTEHDDVDAYSD